MWTIGTLRSGWSMLRWKWSEFVCLMIIQTLIKVWHPLGVGKDSYMNRSRMLVVVLRGINKGLQSHLWCWWWNATLFSCLNTCSVYGTLVEIGNLSIILNQCDKGNENITTEGLMSRYNNCCACALWIFVHFVTILFKSKWKFFTF